MQLETLCQPNGIDLSAMGGVEFAVNRDRLWRKQRLVVFAIDDLASSNRTAFACAGKGMEMAHHGGREFIG